MTVFTLVLQIATVVFAATGLLFVANPALLSKRLAASGYGRNFNYVFGGCALLVAVFLSVPQLRLWGIALATIVLLGTSVALFEREKYLYALPGLVLLGTLPFLITTG